MRWPIFHLLILLATVGCSNVNVDVDSDRRELQDKIFAEEMGGRPADYVRPRVLELPPADYPAEASNLGLAGLVMIKVLVGYDGQVAETEVTQGLHPLLDAAALEAARRGRYTPASKSGIATDGWLTVPFRYPPDAAEEE